jgi:hypothetical protein
MGGPFCVWVAAEGKGGRMFEKTSKPAAECNEGFAMAGVAD